MLTVHLKIKSLFLVSIRSRCLLTKTIKKYKYFINGNQRFCSTSESNVDLFKAPNVVIPKALQASISEIDEVLDFFKSCRYPILEKNETNFTTRDDKFICRAEFTDKSSKEVIIEAYVLPKSISKFPSFFGSKQESADCPELFFRRISRADKGRVEFTIETLKKGFNIITVGLPGIGKSTEMNYMLMEFLRNIGKDGWPKVILLRMETNLYEFYLKDGHPTVTVKYVKELNGDLRDYVKKLCNCPINERPLFFLELNESEVDPQFSFIPTLIYLSSRDAEEMTKTMLKSRRIAYTLMSPPSVEQMKIMMKIQMEFFPKSCKSFDDKPISLVETIIDERIRKIGPIPRFVFGDEFSYDQYAGRIDIDAKNVWKQIENLEVFKVPKYVKTLAAPYVREGVDRPIVGQKCLLDEDDDLGEIVNIHQFRFLSSYCAKLVSENVKNINRLNILSSFKLDYQIAEEVMINGGIMEPTHEWQGSGYLRSNWKFYKDPGFRAILTINDAIQAGEVPNIPYCSKKKIFRSQVYQHVGDIRNLDSESLMISKVHNYLLGECFSVNHNNKEIYFWQSTCVDLNKHPIKSTVLTRVMNGLGMLDEKNEAFKYKLVIVLCADWSREITHGSKFQIQNLMKEEIAIKKKNKESVPFVDYTLKEWQQIDKTGMAKRIETIIARVCYYPNLEEVVLQN